MLEIKLNVNGKEVGGMTLTGTAEIRADEAEMAIALKMQELGMPVLDKLFNGFLNKMYEETVRHNKAKEALEDKDLEWRKERDHQIEYYRDLNEKARAEKLKLQEEVNKLELEVFDLENGFKKPKVEYDEDIDEDIDDSIEPDLNDLVKRP